MDEEKGGNGTPGLNETKGYWKVASMWLRGPAKEDQQGVKMNRPLKN